MMNKPSKVPFIISSLFIFLVIGGYQLIEADFNYKIFLEFSFWQPLLIVQFANILITWSKAKMDIDTYAVTDKEIIDKRNKIKDVVNQNVQNDIDVYLKEKNKERKIDAWKRKINNKIIKLDIKAKRKDKEIYNQGTENQKKKNKYCYKRKKYKKLISDEYIEKNLPYLKVKYIPLRRYEITNGTTQKEEYYRLTRNPNSRILKDALPRFMMSFSFLLVMLSMTPQLKEFSIFIIIDILVKFASITYNYMLAKDYAKQYMSTVYLPDLQYRRDILVDYLSWKVNNKSKIKEQGGDSNVTVRT